MPFRPSVNSKILLPTGEYRFTEHPAAKGMPYGQTGRRATVYQVQNGSGLHALKVFTSAFRIAQTETNAQRIVTFASLPGLQVCSRLVLTRQNAASLVGQYPDLEYAALMPWVAGQTWQEIMLSRQPLTSQQSLTLTQNFASILSTMEQKGIAHCDLSGPNVLISGVNVALVDVEDLYAPGLEQPAKLPGGSAGYGHKTAVGGLWRADADRFAGAVLLAEILAWCDERVRRIAAGEQYFDIGELQTSCDRYQLLLRSLKEKWSDAVANLLERAWYSQNLSDCPVLAEWHSVLSAIQQQASQAQELSAPLPSGGPVVRWRNMADESASQPASSAAVMALLKTAETLSAQGNIEGALVVLHQAREIASPDELAEVNEKMVKLYGRQNFSAPPVPSQSKPFATAASVASVATSPLDDDYNAAIRLFNTKNYADAEVIFRRIYAQDVTFERNGRKIIAWINECEKLRVKKRPIVLQVGLTILITVTIMVGLRKMIPKSYSATTEAPRTELVASTLTFVPEFTTTQLSTNTPEPTSTPLPTNTPKPTATPLPVPISISSVERIERILSLNIDGHINQIAWSIDSKIVAVASSSGIYFYNTGNEKLVRLIDKTTESVSFSPDGKYLASASRGDQFLALWDVKDGSLVRKINGLTVWDIAVVAFSPDGSVLASGDFSVDGTIALWKVSDGSLIRKFNASQSGYILNLDFSPDGTLIAAVSYDGIVRLWRVDDGGLVYTRGNPDWERQYNTCAAFSPNGNLIASAGNRIFYSSGIASPGGGVIYLWKVKGGSTIVSLEGDSKAGSNIHAVAFSQEGSLFVSAGYDQIIRLRQVSDGSLIRTLNGNSSPVNSIAFSPNGNMLASGSYGGELLIWSIK